MVVGVAIFELHIEAAQSLKEKRMVVKILRDRIVHEFKVSVAEVALNDLHQRARIAVSVVSSKQQMAERTIEKIENYIEANSDARIVGSTAEVVHYDPMTRLS
jgi:uncharacterized protein